MQFNSPITKPKLYEVVADKIEKEILSDPSQVGRRMPSEQELADGFSVSRTVVREAVKLLVERKLVSVKNGDGVYAEKPGFDALAQVLLRIILMDEIEYGKINDMCLILEPAACRLAAENCKGRPELLRNLEKIYEDTVSYAEDCERRLHNDFEFHVEIGRLSGNPVLHCFITAVRQMTLLLREKPVSLPGGSSIGVELHGRILDTILEGDGDEVYKIMLSHLECCSQNSDLN